MLQLEKSSCPSYFINDPIEAPISRTVEMNKFVEIPVDKKSISFRRLTCGIGVNDALYQVRPRINGKQIMCHFYSTWVNMIKRCYNFSTQVRQPTYKNCTVCNEWLIFSVFKKWMELQDWKGKELDKDILIPGNKIYSPNNCVFVNRQINTLLNKNKSQRGKYPQGVGFNKCANKFQAYCRINGRLKHLGLFDSAEKASIAYKKSKSKYIISIANEQSDIRIKTGLLAHAELMLK